MEEIEDHSYYFYYSFYLAILAALLGIFAGTMMLMLHIELRKKYQKQKYQTGNPIFQDEQTAVAVMMPDGQIMMPMVPGEQNSRANSGGQNMYQAEPNHDYSSHSQMAEIGQVHISKPIIVTSPPVYSGNPNSPPRAGTAPVYVPVITTPEQHI